MTFKSSNFTILEINSWCEEDNKHLVMHENLRGYLDIVLLWSIYHIHFFLLALFHSFMVFIMADTVDSGGQEYNKMEISLTEFVKLSY